MLRRVGTMVVSSVLTLACSKENPLFGLTLEPDTSTGAASTGDTGDTDDTADAGPVVPTSTDATTGALEGTDSAASDSTGPIVSAGTTSDDGTTTDATTGSTGSETTGDGTTDDGLLDPGPHAIVAAAHCVGVDSKITVTLSIDECAQLIPQQEQQAQTLDYCPGLDPALFGAVAVDFYNQASQSYVTTHLRFSFPEPLAPGALPTAGKLTLTAGCNAQYIAGNPGNGFKPGDVYLEVCDAVPMTEGDKHPMRLDPFPVQPAQEVGGQIAGALEPGERVEWALDDATLLTLLTDGSDLCLSLWAPWNSGNAVNYQGSAGPSPPRLEFTVQ